MSFRKVTIEVLGGVVTVTHADPDVMVERIDHDTGETQVDIGSECR